MSDALFSVGFNVALHVVLLPALVAGSIMTLAWRPWRDETWLNDYWGGSIGIGAAYLVGHWGLGGQPENMPYLGAGIIVIGLVQPLLARISSGFDWEKLIISLAASQALVYAVITFKFSDSHWAGLEAVLWMDVLGLLIVAADWTLDHVARRHSGATIPLAMCVISIAGSAVLVLISVASGSELVGVITVVASVALVLSWWDPSITLAKGGTTVFTLLFASLVLYGFFFSYDDPSPWVGFTMALAPHALWLGEIGPVSQMEGWLATVARVALLVPPLAASALLAWGL